MSAQETIHSTSTILFIFEHRHVRGGSVDALRCSLARRSSRHERSCRRGIPCAPHRVGFYSVPPAGTFGPASTLLLALDRRHRRDESAMATPAHLYGPEYDGAPRGFEWLPP